MSLLATWLKVKLIKVGAAPDLSVPQDHKNVALQMMIGKTFIFCLIFIKDCTTFKFLTFGMNG